MKPWPHVLKFAKILKHWCINKVTNISAQFLCKTKLKLSCKSLAWQLQLRVVILSLEVTEPERVLFQSARWPHLPYPGVIVHLQFQGHALLCKLLSQKAHWGKSQPPLEWLYKRITFNYPVRHFEKLLSICPKGQYDFLVVLLPTEN